MRIQAAWRARQARANLIRLRQAAREAAAAVRIQAAWRRWHARLRFLSVRQATVVLQAAARGRAARLGFLRACGPSLSLLLGAVYSLCDVK